MNHNDKLIQEILRILEMKRHERECWFSIKLLGLLILLFGIVYAGWYVITIPGQW